MTPRAFRNLFAAVSIFSAAPLAAAFDVVDIAAQQIGKGYLSGENGAALFDCSGLTWYSFGALGIEISLTASEQSTMTAGQLFVKPKVSDLQRGDLLFFDTETSATGLVNHVAIYEGDNSFITAIAPGVSARRQNIVTNVVVKGVPWQDRLLYARRMPSLSGTPSSKFSLGDVVEVTDNGVSVRRLRQESLLGQRMSGDKGNIVFGPVLEKVGGVAHWWWKVDFSEGTDGWVAEEYLALVGGAPSPIRNDSSRFVTFSNSTGALTIQDNVQHGLDIGGDMSIQCRIRYNSQPSAQNIFSLEKLPSPYSSADPYAIAIEDHRNDTNPPRAVLGVLLTNPNPYRTGEKKAFVSIPTPIAGQWANYVWVYRASVGTFDMYVDGVHAGTFGGLPHALFDSAGGFRIGGSAKFDGSIDGCAIWNTALTADQAKRGIDQIPSNDAGLISYWPFDGSGADSTANSNTLQISGSGVSFN